MTSVAPRVRELAARASEQDTGAVLWRQGTRQCGSVRKAHDEVLAILVQPDRALDAFNNPYAYAGAHRLCGE